MNTKLLMLGILLIAGLSFAQPPNWNWMEHTTWRYTCNYAIAQGYYAHPAEYSNWHIATSYFLEESDCFDYESMEGYLLDMWDGLGVSSDSGMCDYSGCRGSEYMSASSFRSSMMEYNAATFNFKRLFLSGVRFCLTDPDHAEHYSRAEVLEMLSTQRSSYSSCIADSGNPCLSCDPPI